jgi:hypothetical protein
MFRWIWLPLAAALSLACTPSKRHALDSDSDSNSGGSPEVEDVGGSANAGSANAGGANAGSANAGSGSGGGGSGAGAAGEPNGVGRACDGCVIDGECVSDGASNPENACEHCDADASPASWTLDAGKSCDDAGACPGCMIGQACISEDAVDPSNPCRVCAPSVSQTEYSPNLGASCGSGPGVCSGQDTCDASGVCQPNDLPAGTECSGGECDAGSCEPLDNPFDCIAPDPPASVLPSELYGGLLATPPTAKGGTVSAGRYTPVRVDIYASETTGVDVRTFELSKGFAQVATRPYSIQTGGAFIPEIQFAGTYERSGNSLVFTLQRCDPQYDIDIPVLPYTATANGLMTIEALPDGGTRVISYSRE